ncbi:SDR family oxidoreductase [Ramlibacter sp. G-1-2-2]|uniref:SDR family oxidoreductase n=1 Tax=Ramlibacter agri TaxID=2728837 RepID=A0A848HFD5_9BURK|nr:SDR family oxidoreductase [Ramlibacter agri]NML47243.1 SDR family oxidoreductase [Ramlibacter agri]
MISLKNRTILVTGVTSGLGAGVMRVFSALGATVVGCARRSEQGQAFADELRAQDRDVTFVEADVTAEADRQRLVDACIARTGRLDILVNNAGMLGQIASVQDVALQDWDDVLNVNLTAAFGLCRLALPHMRRQRDGVILNISSLNAVIGITQMAAYCSAKAGLTHLTRVLAAEGWPDNVRANAIILGGVRSEMTEHLSTVLLQRSEGAAPPERVAAAQARRLDPDEVAQSLAALCLPEARLITGSEIAIDQAVTAGAGLSRLLHGPQAATA